MNIAEFVGKTFTAIDGMKPGQDMTVEVFEAEIAKELEDEELRPPPETIAAIRNFIRAAVEAGVEFPDLKVSLFYGELSLMWTVRTTWEEYLRYGYRDPKARVTFLSGARPTRFILCPPETKRTK